MPNDQRLREAFEQLTRYSGEPIPGIVELIEELVEVNDDAKHDRPRSLDRAYGLLISVGDQNRTISYPSRYGT